MPAATRTATTCPAHPSLLTPPPAMPYTTGCCFMLPSMYNRARLDKYTRKGFHVIADHAAAPDPPRAAVSLAPGLLLSWVGLSPACAPATHTSHPPLPAPYCPQPQDYTAGRQFAFFWGNGLLASPVLQLVAEYAEHTAALAPLQLRLPDVVEELATAWARHKLAELKAQHHSTALRMVHELCLVRVAFM